MIFVVLLLFFLLFYAAIAKLKSDYYIFLAFFFALGILGKYWLIKNFNLNLESSGQFNFSDPSMWEKALNYTFAGMLGIVFSTLVAMFLKKRFLNDTKNCTLHTSIQLFFTRKTSLVVLVITIIAASYLNYEHSLNFVGIKSSIDNRLFSLIWSFFINHGFIIIITYFLYINFKSRTLSIPYFLIYLVLTCSISTARLSRGFIFYFTPVYYKAWLKLLEYKQLTVQNITKLSFIFIFFVLTVFTSTKMVNDLRDHKFSVILQSRTETESKKNVDHVIYTNTETHAGVQINMQPAEIQKTALLFLVRFIGFEGIMASAAFKDASPQNLYNALVNNVIDNVSYYDKYVINSTYINMNSDKVKFGTLPGLIGFLGISGNYLIIFLGSFLVTLVCYLFEFLAYKITSNFFANAYYSGFLALGVAQFGFQPLHLFIHHFSIIAFIGILELVIDSKIVRKYIYKNPKDFK